MTLYAVLGIKKTAKATTIRRAYLKRVKETHPDAGGDPVEFQRVQHAWEVLGDPERRARYDDTGAEDNVPPEELELRRKMGAVIGTIVGNIINAKDMNAIKFTDVMVEVHQAMTQKLAMMREDLRKNREQVSRVEELIKRFKHNGDGPDFIVGALNNQKVGLEGSIQSILEAIEFHHKIAAVFREYQYMTDSSWGEGQFSPGGPAFRQQIPPVRFIGRNSTD